MSQESVGYQALAEVKDAAGEIGYDKFRGDSQSKIKQDAMDYLKPIRDAVTHSVETPDAAKVSQELGMALQNAEDQLVEFSIPVADKLHQLRKDSVENLGLPAENVGEGLATAEHIVAKHNRVDERKQEVATNVIKLIGQDGNVSRVLGVEWQTYADQAQVSRSEVTETMLIQDPRFAAYRLALVDKMSAMSGFEEKLSLSDLKSLGERKNWGKVAGKVQYKVNMASINPDVKVKFEEQIFDADLVRRAESNLAHMPSLEVANKYLSDFAVFAEETSMVLDGTMAIGYMQREAHTISSIRETREAVDNQNAIESQAEAFKRGAAMDEVDAAEDERRMELTRQVEAQIEADRQLGAEKIARTELQDLHLQANDLDSAAVQYRDTTYRFLTAIAELDYTDRMVENLRKELAEGKRKALPDELQELFAGDVGEQVDKFIKSKGAKGDYSSVESVLQGLRKLVNRSSNEDGALPNSFLSLNTFEEEGKPSVETGVLAGLAQDGTTWEIKFATRTEDGEIKVDPSNPAMRINGLNLLGSMETIETQEASLQEAQVQASIFEHQLKFPAMAGTKRQRASLERQKSAADASVKAIQESLAISKASLAEQMSTSAVGKTFGGEKGIFAQMTQAQERVARNFFSEDYMAMIGDLATKMDVAPGELVPSETNPLNDIKESLAAMAAEAEYAHIQASEMAEFFEETSTPGYLETKVFQAREPMLENLAFDYAMLQEAEAAIEQIPVRTVKEAAAKKVKTQRRALQKQAKELAATLNQDFIDEVPEAFRKGSKVIGMSKPEFRTAVASTLKTFGLDPKEFQERRPVGPKKRGVPQQKQSVAERTRERLAFTRELRGLADQASDAVQSIYRSETAYTLMDALNGGDVVEFMERVNSAREEFTDGIVMERAKVRSTEAAGAWKEKLGTVEGIMETLRGSREMRAGAIAAIDAGEVEPGEVYAEILQDLELRVEIADIFQDMVMEAASQPFGKANGEPDPMAGRQDLVDKIDFINKVSNGQTTRWMTQYRDRASAPAPEKKTI